MHQRTINWLVYTCLIGLIPVISRIFVWMTSNSGVAPIAISDLVAFGLVLHSSNIQEVSTSNNIDPRWSAVHNGFSVVFLVLYSLILFTTISSAPNLNDNALMKSCLVLSFVSFLISLSIFYRSNIEAKISRGRNVKNG